MKEKIFVSAYACEPNMGTEIGVGWHWTLEMSKYFEVWVLTRKSNQENIEKWIAESPIQYDIHYIYYDLPKSLRFWKKGLRGVRTYYVLWQKLTNSIVKKTMQENDIHIYHLLTYGNSLWPASSYGMKQTFIWGPTGGVDSIPCEYTKYYPIKSRLVEWARRTMVKVLPLNIGFQKRCKNADLIFCKSNSMYDAINEKYRDKAVLFTDVAVEPRQMLSAEKKYRGVKYIVVGRFDPWRGFDILIEAFGKAVQTNQNISLEIIGDGKDKVRLQQIIKKLGIIDYVTFTGKIPIEQYYEKMAACDVVVNSCLKEGAVTAAFDALSFGKPLIGIETGGYTRYFTDTYSIIIPRLGRAETINNLCDAILTMSDTKTRESMSLQAMRVKDAYIWENKGAEIYKEIMHIIERDRRK